MEQTPYPTLLALNSQGSSLHMRSGNQRRRPPSNSHCMIGGPIKSFHKADQQKFHIIKSKPELAVAKQILFKLSLANPGTDVVVKLVKSAFVDSLGQEWIFLTVEEAVAACKFMLHKSTCKPEITNSTTMDIVDAKPTFKCCIHLPSIARHVWQQ